MQLKWYRHSANGTRWHILEDGKPICSTELFDSKKFEADRDFKSVDQYLPLGNKCANCLRIIRSRLKDEPEIAKV